jgi:carboxylate-amine ligase
VSAGIVPAAIIDGAEGYEPELRGRWPVSSAPLGVVGLDVVRDRDGELSALEDNARTPSGFAYAVAARDAVTTTLDDLAPSVGGTTPPPVALEPAIVAALRATMLDAALAVRAPGAATAGREPCVVVLTDGPGCSAFYEHETAAAWLDAPLVTLGCLERRADEVWLRERDGDRARRIDVVYRRTDVDSLRDEHGARTPVAEVLLVPWLAGKVAVVNAFGAGVADDKLVHSYVEQMVRFYLAEEPLLPSVATLDLNDPVVLEHVLSDLRAHVIKPRYGHGGHGVVVCAHAAAADVQRVEAALRRPNAGAEYVAQRTVALSLHPTIVDGRLAQRHIDLRPFAFATRDSVEVVPGGLTRVAREAGSLVVNSSQGGGAKDTWVLT